MYAVAVVVYAMARPAVWADQRVDAPMWAFVAQADDGGGQ